MWRKEVLGVLPNIELFVFFSVFTTKGTWVIFGILGWRQIFFNCLRVAWTRKGWKNTNLQSVRWIVALIIVAHNRAANMGVQVQIQEGALFYLAQSVL